ncbi:hypothetical protein FOA52_013480 [Chlamydomonas sp. UWO 241]|nr:hypothetical protein FOA52_013480 [Chlamydomonas sp. UWO 241]
MRCSPASLAARSRRRQTSRQWAENVLEAANAVEAAELFAHFAYYASFSTESSSEGGASTSGSGGMPATLQLSGSSGDERDSTLRKRGRATAESSFDDEEGAQAVKRARHAAVQRHGAVDAAMASAQFALPAGAPGFAAASARAPTPRATPVARTKSFGSKLQPAGVSLTNPSGNGRSASLKRGRAPAVEGFSGDEGGAPKRPRRDPVEAAMASVHFADSAAPIEATRRSARDGRGTRGGARGARGAQAPASHAASAAVPRSSAPKPRSHRQQQTAAAVLAFISRSGPIEEKTVRNGLGDNADVSNALRYLMRPEGGQLVSRPDGPGGRGNAHLYSLTAAGAAHCARIVQLELAAGAAVGCSWRPRHTRRQKWRRRRRPVTTGTGARER